jgi:hypothetical protein
MLFKSVIHLNSVSASLQLNIPIIDKLENKIGTSFATRKIPPLVVEIVN